MISPEGVCLCCVVIPLLAALSVLCVCFLVSGFSVHVCVCVCVRLLCYLVFNCVLLYYTTLYYTIPYYTIAECHVMKFKYGEEPLGPKPNPRVYAKPKP